MKREDSFEAKYEVGYGYAGASRRPHTFMIYADELEDDMTDEDLISFYEEAVDDNFHKNVSPSPLRVDRFIEWARAHLEGEK